MMIAPWIIFLLYDLLLYVFRAVTYEVPYIGGRARGRQRPRAPSLAERPNGRRRNFSITRVGVSSGVAGSGDREPRRKSQTRGHLKNRSSGGKSWDSDDWDVGDAPVFVDE